RHRPIPHPFTPSPLHPFIPPLSLHIFQTFQHFLGQNAVHWKIWKVRPRHSRAKRLFSKAKSFSRQIGKLKPRVFPSEVDFLRKPAWKIWNLWRALHPGETCKLESLGPKSDWVPLDRILSA